MKKCLGVIIYILVLGGVMYIFSTNLFIELFNISPSIVANLEFKEKRALMGNGFCRQENLVIDNGYFIGGYYRATDGHIGRHIRAYDGDNNYEVYDVACPKCELVEAYSLITIKDGKIVRVETDGSEEAVLNTTYTITAYNLIQAKKKEVS